MKFSIALALTALQATTVLSSHVLTRKGKGFEGRATQSSFGCGENGQCWSQCGNNGEWCWLAYENGEGNRKLCKEDLECDSSGDPSVGCAAGDCDTCGCSA